MENNILLDCAREFDKISHYDYLFTIGKAKKLTIRISLNCAVKDFTHITGLDHLSDIKELSTNKSKAKSSAFQNILSGKLEYKTISLSEHFNKPFPWTYNSSTGSEYTLTERISALRNISEILDNAYKGNFYKWNCSNSCIRMPNGKTRNSGIKADFMLSIPSKSNPQERFYLFMYEDKPKEKNTKRLCVFSAFADCLDLSAGQEWPYTILKEEKEDFKTKTISSLFVHPNFIQEETPPTEAPTVQKQNTIKK